MDNKIAILDRVLPLLAKVGKTNIPQNSARPIFDKASIKIPAFLDIDITEGGRNAHASKIAGYLIKAGFAEERALSLLHDWNENTLSDPLDVTEIDSVFDSIQRTHYRNHPSDDDNEGLFDIETARINKLIETELTPRKWLLKGSLPLGKVGLIIAPGGTSKSQLALQLGVSVATGLPLVNHWEIGETGKSLLLLAEDDSDEIQRRLHNIVRFMSFAGNAEKVSSLKENLFVKSMLGQNNLITIKDKNGEVVQTNYIKKLLNTVSSLTDLRLIVLDPGSRFRGGEENSNEDATRFIEGLEIIAKATNANVLVLHHTHKGSFNSEEQLQTASRGASALTDGARWQMNLRTLSIKDANEHGVGDHRKSYLYAEVTKNNYGAPSPPVLIKREDGGYLQISSKEEAGKAETNRKIVKVLSAISKLSKPMTTRGFIERYAKADGPFEMSNNIMRKFMDKLILNGFIDGGARKHMIISDKGKSLIKDVLDESLH